MREFLGYGVFVAVILGLMLGYTSWQVTLIGAIVLVASGVLTEREAIENMNMSTVLLYVGVSAFGTALAQTGAAEMLADVFSKMLDGITNGYIVGFTFYVVGFLMTSLLYNRAVSTVLIPWWSLHAVLSAVTPAVPSSWWRCPPCPLWSPPWPLLWSLWR